MKNKFTEPFEDVYDQDYKSYDVVKNAEGKATEAVESELRGLDSNEHMSGVVKAEDKLKSIRKRGPVSKKEFAKIAVINVSSVGVAALSAYLFINNDQGDPGSIERFLFIIAMLLLTSVLVSGTYIAVWDLDLIKRTPAIFKKRLAKAEESFTRARIDAIRKSASYSARADVYDISISSEFFLERHGVNVEEMDPSEVELFVLAYDSAKPEHERDRVKKIAEAVDTVKSESRLKSYAQENRARIDSVREGAKS